MKIVGWPGVVLGIPLRIRLWKAVSWAAMALGAILEMFVVSLCWRYWVLLHTQGKEDFGPHPVHSWWKELLSLLAGWEHGASVYASGQTCSCSHGTRENLGCLFLLHRVVMTAGNNAKHRKATRGARLSFPLISVQSSWKYFLDLAEISPSLSQRQHYRYWKREFQTPWDFSFSRLKFPHPLREPPLQ